jgi:hypothetical protein
MLFRSLCGVVHLSEHRQNILQRVACHFCSWFRWFFDCHLVGLFWILFRVVDRSPDIRANQPRGEILRFKGLILFRPVCFQPPADFSRTHVPKRPRICNPGIKGVLNHLLVYLAQRPGRYFLPFFPCAVIKPASLTASLIALVAAAMPTSAMKASASSPASLSVIG